MAPMRAENTMAFTSSNVTPRLGPSRVKIQAPKRNPMAMPMPCGETAKLPNRWMRSRIGHPMAPSAVTEASLSSVLRHRVAHGLAEEEPTDDVGRVVHSHVDARDPDRGGQAPKRGPGGDGELEVPSRDRHEREQDGGMAARPRCPPRWLGEQPDTVRVGRVRPWPIEQTLQPLSGEPCGGSGRESAGGGSPATRGRQHRRRADGGPDRPELGDP